MAPSWPLGLFLIVVGLAGFGFGQGIPADAVGNNADPGPRLFPLALSLILFLGGGGELIRSFRSGGVSASGPLWKEEGARTFFAVGGLLCGFFLLVPWLGFSLGMVLLVLLFLRLKRVSWKVALATAFALVVVVRFLFGWLFRIQLPEGWLESFL